MRIALRTVFAFLPFLALLLAGASARASEIGPDGSLTFAGGALATYRFDTYDDLRAAGAAWIVWGTNGQLVATAVKPGEEASILTAEALEGSHALVVRQGLGPGIAILDDRLLPAVAKKRLSVTMWGRAFGAEPVLEVVYGRGAGVGPGLTRVVAIRTGRETSDGWVEYATGPIDGSVWGAPMRAIVLTARYATEHGASMLVAPELSPLVASPPGVLDPDAYAVIDAVEVRPEPGPATAAAGCSQATIDAACGPGAECEFGHCVDGSVVWGPVPQAADHRRDLVARWAFLAQHLHGDRKATATAAVTFAGAAEALAAVTSPRGYYGGLNRLITSVRDSHTQLGQPPSMGSVVYPMLDMFSGPLDVCFGVAQNDLAAGETVLAVFKVGPSPTTTEKLQPGDVLTAVDGMPAAAWIAATLPRFAPKQPNDPAADPSQTALVLPKLLGRFATTITFSRCQPGGGCARLPDVPIADEVWRLVRQGQGYSGSTMECTLRFHPAVAHPPPDLAPSDAVVVETDNGVASVQFDGFDGALDRTHAYSTWQSPMTTAFAAGRVVVDARLGHGGRFVLGKWLFHLLRGTDQPTGMFAMPRGAWDDPDPPWLLSSRWDACNPVSPEDNACAWAGGQTCFTSTRAPAGEAAKIAWIDGNDVSMNDIVPRLLLGRANVRIFGPHPSHGAYGEVSYLPPIEPSWSRGSMQVLDMRFGPNPASARAAAWESGTGVPPDEVVLQKVSDILADRDTVLDAARKWVSQ